MRRILFLSLVLSIVPGVGRAETHRCTVDTQKAMSNRPDELTIRTNSAIDIGSFDVIVAKDADVSKVYRLPGTSLFVIATVSYEDHILGSEQHPDFVNMRIFVSPSRRADYLTAVAYAETQVPFKAFGPDDFSTVTAVLRLRGRSIMMVGMSCIRH
jgi:hypothetical protein